MRKIKLRVRGETSLRVDNHGILFSAAHAPDDLLPPGLIVRAMIKCSRSLPCQDNTRVSFGRESRALSLLTFLSPPFSFAPSPEFRRSRANGEDSGRLEARGEIKQGNDRIGQNCRLLSKQVVSYTEEIYIEKGELFR